MRKLAKNMTSRWKLEKNLTTFDITDTVRVKRWSPFSVDGPDSSPNSPFAADVRAILGPTTAGDVSHLGARKQVWLTLRFREGMS